MAPDMVSDRAPGDAMIELKYKPDFPKVMERFEAWWQCEIIDRPLATIPVKPARLSKLPAKSHATPRDRWLDVEYSLECFEATVECGVYLGETIPMYLPNIGPEGICTLFGCELDFTEFTTYSRPAAESIRDILKIQPDFENFYWKIVRKMTDLSLQRGAGKWLTGISDLHGNGDLLASLRGPENLCLDIADDIEGVRLACDRVTEFFPRIYEDLYGRIAAAGQPATTWLNLPHWGKYFVSSCDFISLISPDHFGRTILPSIIRENEYLERKIFHLDGPGAVKHLDAILREGNVDGIQWGHGSRQERLDVYKKAQAAGKCIHISAWDLDDAKAIAKEIRPEGAFFYICGECEAQQAEDFLRWLERWGAGKE